jgi:hypothetical protein
VNPFSAIGVFTLKTLLVLRLVTTQLPDFKVVSAEKTGILPLPVNKLRGSSSLSLFYCRVGKRGNYFQLTRRTAPSVAWPTCKCFAAF